MSKDELVVTVQKAVRGWLTRRYYIRCRRLFAEQEVALESYERALFEDHASARLAAAWRGHSTRVEVAELKAERERKEDLELALESLGRGLEKGGTNGVYNRHHSPTRQLLREGGKAKTLDDLDHREAASAIQRNWRASKSRPNSADVVADDTCISSSPLQKRPSSAPPGRRLNSMRLGDPRRDSKDREPTGHSSVSSWRTRTQSHGTYAGLAHRVHSEPYHSPHVMASQVEWDADQVAQVANGAAVRIQRGWRCAQARQRRFELSTINSRARSAVLAESVEIEQWYRRWGICTLQKLGRGAQSRHTIARLHFTRRLAKSTRVLQSVGRGVGGRMIVSRRRCSRELRRGGAAVRVQGAARAWIARQEVRERQAMRDKEHEIRQRSVCDAVCLIQRVARGLAARTAAHGTRVMHQRHALPTPSPASIGVRSARSALVSPDDAEICLRSPAESPGNWTVGGDTLDGRTATGTSYTVPVKLGPRGSEPKRSDSRASGASTGAINTLPAPLKSPASSAGDSPPAAKPPLHTPAVGTPAVESSIPTSARAKGDGTSLSDTFRTIPIGASPPAAKPIAPPRDIAMRTPLKDIPAALTPPRTDDTSKDTPPAAETPARSENTPPAPVNPPDDMEGGSRNTALKVKIRRDSPPDSPPKEITPLPHSHTRGVDTIPSKAPPAAVNTKLVQQRLADPTPPGHSPARSGQTLTSSADLPPRFPSARSYESEETPRARHEDRAEHRRVNSQIIETSTSGSPDSPPRPFPRSNTNHTNASGNHSENRQDTTPASFTKEDLAVRIVGQSVLSSMDPATSVRSVDRTETGGTRRLTPKSPSVQNLFSPVGQGDSPAGHSQLAISRGWAAAKRAVRVEHRFKNGPVVLKPRLETPRVDSLSVVGIQRGEEGESLHPSEESLRKPLRTTSFSMFARRSSLGADKEPVSPYGCLPLLGVCAAVAPFSQPPAGHNPFGQVAAGIQPTPLLMAVLSAAPHSVCQMGDMRFDQASNNTSPKRVSISSSLSRYELSARQNSGILKSSGGLPVMAAGSAQARPTQLVPKEHDVMYRPVRGAGVGLVSPIAQLPAVRSNFPVRVDRGSSPLPASAPLDREVSDTVDSRSTAHLTELVTPCPLPLADPVNRSGSAVTPAVLKYPNTECIDTANSPRTPVALVDHGSSPLQPPPAALVEQGSSYFHPSSAMFVDQQSSPLPVPVRAECVSRGNSPLDPYLPVLEKSEPPERIESGTSPLTPAVFVDHGSSPLHPPSVLTTEVLPPVPTAVVSSKPDPSESPPAPPERVESGNSPLALPVLCSEETASVFPQPPVQPRPPPPRLVAAESARFVRRMTPAELPPRHQSRSADLPPRPQSVCSSVSEGVEIREKEGMRQEAMLQSRLSELACLESVERRALASEEQCQRLEVEPPTPLSPPAWRAPAQFAAPRAAVLPSAEDRRRAGQVARGMVAGVLALVSGVQAIMHEEVILWRRLHSAVTQSELNERNEVVHTEASTREGLRPLQPLSSIATEGMHFGNLLKEIRAQGSVEEFPSDGASPAAAVSSPPLEEDDEVDGDAEGREFLAGMEEAGRRVIHVSQSSAHRRLRRQVEDGFLAAALATAKRVAGVPSPRIRAPPRPSSVLSRQTPGSKTTAEVRPSSVAASNCSADASSAGHSTRWGFTPVPPPTVPPPGRQGMHGGGPTRPRTADVSHRGSVEVPQRGGDVEGAAGAGRDAVQHLQSRSSSRPATASLPSATMAK
eukprot:Hpha_TRINITY_DN10836_c0_g1::TRINITY_DN10836_c0_g1_i1::g.23150::m.23150